MLKYIARRLLQAIPVLIGISLVTFAILQFAPGGPEARFAQNVKVTTEQIAAFRHRWGLDQPIPVQYCRWLGVCNPDGSGLGVFISNKGLPNFLPASLGGGDNGILHGDFGISVTDGRPVSEVIGERVGPTVILAGTSYFFWLLIAFISGVYAAVKRYSKFDSALTIFNYVGFSLPTFWLGMMLIQILATPPFVLFPAGGMWSVRTIPPFGTSDYWTFFGAQPLTALTDLAWHLALPVVTLIVVNIAADSRFIRASMLDSLDQDFVKTARAKGVPERTVVFKHALRNALLPVITNIGLTIPFLFAGAVVTETIFSWPGMGRLYIEAVSHYDYPVLMGVLIISALIVLLANLVADVAYAVVDPRVRYD
jgi:peptide/nickel transport system permease protein